MNVYLCYPKVLNRLIKTIMSVYVHMIYNLIFKRPSDRYPTPTRPHPNGEKEIERVSLPKSFKHYLYNYTYTCMLLTRYLCKSIHVSVSMNVYLCYPKVLNWLIRTIMSVYVHMIYNWYLNDLRTDTRYPPDHIPTRKRK